MSVKQMLNSMDSEEYSHWIAYERAYGPLDGEWQQKLFASMHEQIQVLNYMTSQANFTSEKGPSKGPYPIPQEYPLPGQTKKPLPQSFEEGDFEDEWLPPTEDELLAAPIVIEDDDDPEGDDS